MFTVSKEEQEVARVRVAEHRRLRLEERQSYLHHEKELLNKIPESFHQFVTEFCWNHNNADENGSYYIGALVLMEDLVNGIRDAL